MKTLKCVILSFLILALFNNAAPAESFDPDLDYNNNGKVECMDLFEGCTHWMDQTASAFTETDLLKMLNCWHSDGQASSDLTLSIPSMISVELEEIVPGSFMGSAAVPVQLSEVNGLTEMELWVPMLPQDTSNQYTVIVGSGADLTQLTAGFNLVQEATTSADYTVSYQVFKISSNEAITQSGPGTLLTLNAQVIPAGQNVPQDVVVPVLIAQSELKAGSSLAHCRQDGSLLINPSGGPTWTPTETPGEPTVTSTPVDTATPTATNPDGATNTPTPTPTEEPATATPTNTRVPTDSAAELQIICCNPQEIAGNELYVYVDLLDAQGRIVNPGVEGGDTERQITLSLSGSATFPGNLDNQTWTTTIESEDGLKVAIEDTTVEQVSLTASSPGLTSAQPLSIEFLPGGNISGTVQVYDPSITDFRPAGIGEVMIDVYIPGATETITSAMTGMSFLNPGYYETSYITPGTYDVSFSVGMGSSLALQTNCVTGIVVQNGQTTGDVNTDLDERTGARVFGTITSDDGVSLLSGWILLTPEGGQQCGKATIQTTAVPQGDTLNYEFLAVPDGEYSVFAFASGEGDISYFPSQQVIVNVAGQDIQKDIEVAANELLAISFVSPINYERAANQPTFSWSMAEQISGMKYTVTLNNRCEEVWKKSDISGLSVQYNGTQLPANHIYNWRVMGFDIQSGQSAISRISAEIDSKFVVE